MSPLANQTPATGGPSYIEASGPDVNAIFVPDHLMFVISIKTHIQHTYINTIILLQHSNFKPNVYIEESVSISEDYFKLNSAEHLESIWPTVGG